MTSATLFAHDYGTNYDDVIHFEPIPHCILQVGVHQQLGLLWLKRQESESNHGR